MEHALGPYLAVRINAHDSVVVAGTGKGRAAAVDAFNEAAYQTWSAQALRRCANCDRSFTDDAYASHAKSCSAVNPARRVGKAREGRGGGGAQVAAPSLERLQREAQAATPRHGKIFPDGLAAQMMGGRRGGGFDKAATTHQYWASSSAPSPPHRDGMRRRYASTLSDSVMMSPEPSIDKHKHVATYSSGRAVVGRARMTAATSSRAAATTRTSVDGVSALEIGKGVRVSGRSTQGGGEGAYDRNTQSVGLDRGTGAGRLLEDVYVPTSRRPASSSGRGGGGGSSGGSGTSGTSRNGHSSGGFAFPVRRPIGRAKTASLADERPGALRRRPEWVATAPSCSIHGGNSNSGRGGGGAGEEVRYEQSVMGARRVGFVPQFPT